MSNVRVSLSKEQKHLVFSQKVYDDMDLEITDLTKRAIRELNPDSKRTPAMILATAQAVEWVLIGQPDNAGFYQAAQASEVNAVSVAEEEEVEQDA